MAKAVDKLKLSKNASSPNKSWCTIRVFVSSTFRDMQAERDYLAKVVFPELRDRMNKRNLHLVDLDLRWGVTEQEAEQGKVLDVILGEIDRSRPFFVGLLGEHYGSLPDKIPEQTKHAYPWLKDYEGYSYTSLEVVHGVLRNPELTKQAFFYFRDSKLIQQIPETKRIDYVAETPQSASQLANLKNKIRSTSCHVMENYPCRWDEPTGRVVDLEVFGQKVLEDLWAAICEEYPSGAPEVDPVVIERQMHEAFVEERSYLHFGRAEQTAQLTKFVQGNDRRPVVITGESGCGKSAFLASWYRSYSQRNPNDYVLAYFLGTTPDSTNHYKLLRNVCIELRIKFKFEEELPREDKKLPETLLEMLTRIIRGTYVNRVIILLDALDQLLPFEAAHGLSWLLDYIPSNVNLIVSSLKGECLDVLRRHNAEEIILPQLDINEQHQIVFVLLELWGRKLDEKQIEALLAHAEARTPLYLRIALEELRLFGKFEQVTQRIINLPSSVTELFEQVLSRLEEDNGSEFVAEVFAFISCSRFGLSETELLDLLSIEELGRVPRILWARLVLGTKMYLVQRGEFFSFFHSQLGEAVKKRYLSISNKHAKLAEYFSCSPLDRRIDEFPYQLQHAKKLEALALSLSDLNLLQYVWDHNRELEWVGYWLSAKESRQIDSYYQTSINKKIEKEGESQNVAYLSSLIGGLLIMLGLYSAASTFLQLNLKITETACNPNHPGVAMSLNNLANLYREQGRYDDALPLFQRAIKIDEIALGPNHPEVAILLNNMAMIYGALGRYDEALHCFLLSLKIKKVLFGPNHPEIASCLSDLGVLYRHQGRYDEALLFHQQALKIREFALPPNHPAIANSLNNLAWLYYSQKKYDDALPLYSRAIKIDEIALGPNHPEVATLLNNMAMIYSALGRDDLAFGGHKQALEIQEATLPPNHPAIANSLNNLASLYSHQGKYEDAIHLYQRVIKIDEITLPPNHPDAVTSLNNLALLYRTLGRYDEALPLFTQVLKIREASLGPNHPATVTVRNNLKTYIQTKISGNQNNHGKNAEANVSSSKQESVEEQPLPEKQSRWKNLFKQR